jgi:hypothetical protein
MMSGAQLHDFTRFSFESGSYMREGLMQGEILCMGEPTEIIPACR